MTGSMPGIIRLSTKDTAFRQKDQIVHRNCRRQGIGGMLVREAHARASKAGYTGSVLLGHKDYYPRFGYRRASAYGISFPFDAPDECCMAAELTEDECCMAAELTEGGLDGIHGVVKYPDAFLLE